MGGVSSPSKSQTKAAVPITSLNNNMPPPVVKSSSIMKRSRPGARQISRRSVSFPEAHQELAQVVGEVEPIMTVSDEDRKNLWFSRSDYHLARSTARVIAKESERYGHSKQLDHVYGMTHPSLPHDNDDEGAVERRKRRHAISQDQLNMWAFHGHSRRGLERWANSAHGHVRKEDQYVYLHGLLRAQQDLKFKLGIVVSNRNQGGSNDLPPHTTNNNKIDDVLREHLCQLGAKLSHKARLFAQMMGEADAQAAWWAYRSPGPTTTTTHHSNPAMISPGLQRKNLGLSSSLAEASQPSTAAGQDTANAAGLPQQYIQHHRCHQIDWMSNLPQSRSGPLSPPLASMASSRTMPKGPNIPIQTRTGGRTRARMA